LQEIETRNKGKISNPFHPWNQYLNQCVNQDQKGNKVGYKELLVYFHPDKHLNQIQKATEYFQLIQQWIEMDQTDSLHALMESDDKWSKMQELTNELYSKIMYCKQTQHKRWFSWSALDDATFITEEELKQLLETENQKLEAENEKLRRDNASLKMEKEQLTDIFKHYVVLADASKEADAFGASTEAASTEADAFGAS